MRRRAWAWTVTCSSKKDECVKSGRIGANTGVNFFSYRRNFDMIYDIHKVNLSLFLLVKIYLLIRYRNRLTYFLTKTKRKWQY